MRRQRTERSSSPPYAFKPRFQHTSGKKSTHPSPTVPPFTKSNQGYIFVRDILSIWT